jgi:hypothetical protein
LGYSGHYKTPPSLGRIGNLLSAGTILLAGLAVRIAVAFGSVLLVNDFIEQALLIRVMATQ